MEWLWLKTFGWLLLILGLIVGTMWLLKRFLTFGTPAARGGIGMEIVGVLHLGPRRAVYAVKAGSQVILLGAAEHAITYLTQLSGAPDPGSAAGTQQTGAAAPFFDLLKEQFDRGTAGAQEKHQDMSPEIPVTEKKSKSPAASRKKAAKPL